MLAPEASSHRLGRSGNLLLLLTAVFAAGCTTTGLRFKQTPVPPLPYVLAGADGQYKVSAIAINNTDDAVAAGRIEMFIEARYNTQYADKLCHLTNVKNNPHMPANGGEWHVLNFDFDGGVPGDKCSCRTGSQCTGVVWVTLRRASTNLTLPGPRTYMSIKFDGPLASQITVKDLSE